MKQKKNNANLTKNTETKLQKISNKPEAVEVNKYDKSEIKHIIDSNVPVMDKVIEKVIREQQNRKKIYIVYDEELNKWKAIKEGAKRAIKTTNTKTSLLKEIRPLAKAENYELVILKKRDVRKYYQSFEPPHK